MSVPILGANGQPRPQPMSQFKHIHGKPNPCTNVAIQVMPLVDGDSGEQVLGFLSTGGVTAFEQQAMETARTLAAGYFRDGRWSVVEAEEIADMAVSLTKQVFQRCREVDDPYQRLERPKEEASASGE